MKRKGILQFKNPLEIPAGFYILVPKRLFKDFRKITASVLLLTFTYTQLLFAADPRELLAQAKAGFEEPDMPRLGGSNPSQLASMQSQQQSIVDQQNNLEELQNLNFSLTTQNGDILKYVHNTLKEVKTKDGNVLQNIQVDAQGLIQNADLHLLDGSIQVLQNGKLQCYTTPSGSRVDFDPSTGRVNKVTSSDGIVSNYTYTLDNTGKVLTTTILNDTSTSVYNSNNRLISIAEDNKAYYQFNDGVLKLALIYNQGFFSYDEVSNDQEIKATLKDSSGCEVPNADTNSLPEEITYNLDKSIKEVTLRDGTHFTFKDNLLKSIQDKDGQTIDFDFTQSLFGNLIQTNILQNNLNTTYNKEGNLQSIKLEGLTLHYKEDTTLDYIEEEDGTTLEDILFDTDGNIQNATVVTPNGEVRTYENGLLKEVTQNDTHLFYDLGKPFKLIQKDLEYNFDYTPTKIEAHLVIPAEAGIGSPIQTFGDDTVFSYEYDSDFNLKKQILKDQSIIEYLNDNNDYSFTLTKDNTQSFYDKQNQIQKTVINPTTGSTDTLNVIYKYGKIREIHKNNTLTFKYSYAFDTDGSEKTIIEDLEEHSTKTYKNELLLTSLDNEMNVLSTYSYDQERVKEVQVTRLGRTLHTYTYSYEGENTIVLDEEGTIRTYNQYNKLLFLEKDNQKWTYTYAKNETLSALTNIDTDEEIITESLVQKTLENGSVVHYDNKGQIQRIDLTDGSFITDVMLNEDRTLKQASIHLLDGTVFIYNSSTLLEKVALSNTHYYYKDSLLEKVTTSQGQEYNYLYDKDKDGSIMHIWVPQENLKLDYDSSGNLLGLRLNDVLTKDQVILETLHDYEGMQPGTGPWAEDGNLDTRAFNSISGSGGGGRGVSLFVTNTFPVPQTIDSITFQMYASGYSHDGKDWRGYEAAIRVEALINDTWVTVPDTYWSYRTDNRTSGEITFNPGVITLNNLNLQNVQAIRAYAHGFGNSSYEGNQGGSAAINEFQYTLIDQSYFNYSEGNFQNPIATYDFGAPILTKTPYFNEVHALLPENYSYWLRTTHDSILDSTQITSQEYSESGKLETQTKANETITLFNDQNKPDKVTDQKGEVLIEYSYDDSGNLSKVYLKNARDTLPDQVNEAELSIEEQKVKELETLAQQKNLAYESIKSQTEPQRQYLESQLNSLENQFNDISGTKVKGKKAKNQKGEALNQIGDAMGQVRSALSELLAQESEAYANLDLSIRTLSDQIESDSHRALEELHTQENNLKHVILAQEINPIVYDHYRRILGRDPSTEEYESWINRVDYEDAASSGSRSINIQSVYKALSFDGSGDFLVIGDNDEWAFEDKDFTVEAYFNTTGSTRIQPILSQAFVNENDGWGLYLAPQTDGSYKLQFRTEQNSSASPLIFTHETAIQEGAWHHAAIVRSGNELNIYLDGIRSYLSLPFSGFMKNKTSSLYVGKSGLQSPFSSPVLYFNGKLDSVRIIKGQAEYATNFNPVRLVPDSRTSLLIRSKDNHFIDEGKLHLTLTSYGNTKADSNDLFRESLTEALSRELTNSQELKDREAYVHSIQQNVKDSLELYLRTPDNQKAPFAASLSLEKSDLINLTESDAQKIVNWLNTRSLHFGQSAFLSLEALLDQKNISYDRVELASKCILIDILTGVISPLDDGDLVISMFALNKAAKSYGLELSGVNISWEDLRALYNPPSTIHHPKIVAHINGNHYIIITGITNDTITYIDPGAGPDKHNQIETISKKDFLQAWQGNVTAERSQLTAVIPSEAQGRVEGSRLLTKDETQKIRGAFFFFFIPAIIGAITSIGTAIAGVLASIGTILSSIGSLVANIVTGIGQVLGSLAQGISSIGNALYQGIHFAASSLFGAFGGNVGTIASQSLFGSITKASFGQTFLQNIVQRGLTFVVTRGLDALGINPSILNFASSFTGGNPLNLINPSVSQSIFQNFIPNLAIQGTKTLLGSIGTPNLTQALSLASGNFIDGILHGNLGNQFLNIGQNLLKSASLFGIQALSSSLGINPGLLQGLGGTLSNLFNGQGIIQSVNQSLIGGTSAYTVNFEGNSDPIFGSLFSQDILGSIGASIFGDEGLFRNVFNIVGGSVSSLVNGIQSFGSLIQQKGLFGALDSMIGSLFGRGVQETVVNQGGVANLFGNSQSVLLPNGQSANEVRIDSSNAFYFDNETKLIGILNDDTYEIGDFSYDDQGSISFWDGNLYSFMDGGYNIESTFHDGQTINIFIQGPDNEPLFEINPERPGQAIHLEVPTLQNPQPSFNLWDGMLNVISQGLTFNFNRGITDVAQVSLNIGEGLAQKYNDLINEVFLKEPHTDIIYKGNMVAADMKLDWIGDIDTMLKDTLVARGLFWYPANVRWSKAITDAVPKIANLMKDPNNKFIFTPGVNSGIKSTEHPEYRSMDEIELLKNSFNLSDKRIMFAHSAGTEAQLKAILKAKQDGVDLSQFKFVFASPRVSRATFIDYLGRAGIQPDQVFVITAESDYPHFVTDMFPFSPDLNDIQSFFPSLRDYENSGGKYHYLFLNKDLSFEADPLNNENRVFHGGMIDGAIEDHEYEVTFDGRVIPRIKIGDLYKIL